MFRLIIPQVLLVSKELSLIWAQRFGSTLPPIDAALVQYLKVARGLIQELRFPYRLSWRCYGTFPELVVNGVSLILDFMCVTFLAVFSITFLFFLLLAVSV